MELAGRHLLQRGRVEDAIDALHSLQHAGVVTHVAQKKLYAPVRQMDAHVLLLLLVPREDANLSHRPGEEAPRDGMAKGTGAPGDQDRLLAQHVIRIHSGSPSARIAWIIAGQSGGA